MYLKGIHLFIALLTVFTIAAQPTDTLTVTVPQAEKLLIQNNLSLLSSHYNIDAHAALVQQARHWDNPLLSSEQNLYDGKFFRHGKGTASIPENGGQLYLSLQQVLLTAGKRQKLVQLAQDATQSSEAQYDDLMRNLHYILITDLAHLSELQTAQHLFESEIIQMQKLAKGMDEMLKLGDVSLKENIRIKALLYSLQSDYADNLRQQQDFQKEIKTLLQLPENTVVSVENPTVNVTSINTVNILSILDSVAANRPDVRVAASEVAYQQHHLMYQQALATPDVTVGIAYDHANSYVPNYYGLQLAMPLPLFNKNRGNIIAAQWGMKGSQTEWQQRRTAAQQEVIAAYQKIKILASLQKSSDTDWQQQYDKLLQNMLTSYEAKKVGLLDFIDFFDSYKETKLKQLEQQTNIITAVAELNYTTNQTCIPIH